MSKKDINSNPFSEETQLKLSLFRRCFREWFPVFIHNNAHRKIYIYDLFAGSGMDTQGNPGSPIILLEEARGEDAIHCKALSKSGKEAVFAFNEMEVPKEKLLESAVNKHLAKCIQSCPLLKCIFDGKVFFSANRFGEIFDKDRFQIILNNPQIAKFILLDQYGFKQITDERFVKLVNAPFTDFIFFISSSFIRRFREHPAVTAYFNTKKISFDITRPKDCHEAIKDYFQSLIPERKEYYLHSFTIQNRANYYGLIFGTSHTLGMEKFLAACWKEDPLSGNSNCNLNNDYECGTLFYDPNESNKKIAIKQLVKDKILNGEITDNIGGLTFVLKQGGRPKLFQEVVNELKKNKEISLSGDVNQRTTDIHKVPLYNITVL